MARRSKRARAISSGARRSPAKRRLDSLAAVEPRIVTAPRIPSLALRLARVATGALDGTFAAPNSHDWDLSAADLFGHEAGGLVATFLREAVFYHLVSPAPAPRSHSPPPR